MHTEQYSSPPLLTGGVDLHLHSIRSDGTQSVDTVCALAKAAGQAYISLTDHDVALSHQEAAALSAQHGLYVIPGVELNVIQELDSMRTQQHTNLYWLPDDDPEVQQILLHNQQQPRDLYIHLMLRPLIKDGVIPAGVSEDRAYEMVLEQRPKADYHGKRDVINMLVNNGWVSSPEEARHYLTRHGNGLAYVNQAEIMDYPTIPQILDLVQRLNKKLEYRVVSQFNHPNYTLDPHQVRPAVQQCAQLGLHMLEVEYTRYDEKKRQPLRVLAKELGLMIGCGSDRHDPSRDFFGGDPALAQALIAFHLRKE